MKREELSAEKCETLLKALNRIRRCLCAYCPPEHVNKEKSHSDRFCDCKYGADRVGAKSEDGNGCPEMRDAMRIIKAYCDLTNKPKRKRKRKKTEQ